MDQYERPAHLKQYFLWANPQNCVTFLKEFVNNVIPDSNSGLASAMAIYKP